MELIRGINNIRNRVKCCAITIGNFDGLHLGHQQLINKLSEVSKKLKVPSLLITFEPQPNEFFNQGETVPRLMRFREKWHGLENFEIDLVLCIRFNQAFANISPQDFVEKLLVKQLGVKAIIVGDDFRFGAKRVGDFKLLQEYGRQHDFVVMDTPTLQLNGVRISSTRVRDALQAGDLQRVQKLLGRNYRLCGKVIHGDRVGRQLGFPTANFNLHRELVPLGGVFVVRAYGINDKPINGVANLGTRPAFGGTRVLLEVHLFDFNQQLYGRNLQIEFLHKLRDEEYYDRIEDLVMQIKKDIENGKNYFSQAVKHSKI